MIVSFGDRATEDLYHTRKCPRGMAQNMAKVALRKLDLLNAATDLKDLRSPPANRLESLHGDLDGFWSIRVNDQWRIVFEWQDGDASLVRITDYH